MSGVLRKSVLGVAVAVFFFAAVEVVLLVAGVTPLKDRTDPYVGFAGYAPLFVEATTADGHRVFRTADAKFDWFNRQEFPAAKGPEVTRIFCLGGSTTYGRPYDDATSFCGWLREFLPRVDASRRWEVVNAGGISYASYRIVRLMEELAGYEPDLFVVYTGHNEFLERRTYDRLLRTPEIVRDAGSLASGLRLYSVLSDAVFPTRDVLDSEIDNILDDAIGPEDYHRDDVLRGAVEEHFRVSLEGMVRIAADAGARVVFVTPSSNIRDFSPFKAEPREDLGLEARRRVEQLKASIAELLEAEDYEGAADLADEAVALDGRDAEVRFLHGRALLGLDDVEGARLAFVRARDEDVAPLRAPTPLARIVREVASATSSGLVDFAAMMREASPEGIPGEDLFLDHVHPSIEAHRILALALVEELARMEVARPGPAWNEAAVAEVTERVAATVDEVANARALANVARVLSWAGKQDEALGLVERATGMARDPHTLYQTLTVMLRNGRDDDALVYAEEAAQLMPGVAEVRKMYGIVLSDQGRPADALPELEAAARLAPTAPDVHYHLGVVLTDLGQAGRAEGEYGRAVELDPTYADALNNLGILLAQRGDVHGALRLFERAVESNPGHPDAAQNLQRARRMLGG